MDFFYSKKALFLFFFNLVWVQWGLPKTPTIWFTPPAVTLSKSKKELCFSTYTVPSSGFLDTNILGSFTIEQIRIQMKYSENAMFFDFFHLYPTGKKIKAKKLKGVPIFSREEEVEEWSACLDKEDFEDFDSMFPFSIVATNNIGPEQESFVYLSPGQWIYLFPHYTGFGLRPEEVGRIFRDLEMFIENVASTYTIHHLSVEYTQDREKVILRIYGVVADTDICHFKQKKGSEEVFVLGFTVRPVEASERGAWFSPLEKMDKGTLFLLPLCSPNQKQSGKLYKSSVDKRKWSPLTPVDDTDGVQVRRHGKLYYEFILPKSIFSHSPTLTYEIHPYAGSVPLPLGKKLVETIDSNLLLQLLFLRFADEVHCCTIPKELLKGK